MKVLLSMWLVLGALSGFAAQNGKTNTSSFVLKDGRQILTDGKQMSAYTFDVDDKGVSNCYDSCELIWPVISTTESSLEAPFGVHVRKDGVKQVTFNDQPLYLYQFDTAVGATSGDGVGGVWHLIDLSKELKSCQGIISTVLF